MQAPAPTKRRKLILAVIICLLVFLGLMLFRNGLHKTTSTNSNVFRQTRSVSELTSQVGTTPLLTKSELLETTPLFVTDTAQMSPVGPSTSDAALLAWDRFPQGGTVFLGYAASSTFAVVDLQRVLDAIRFQTIEKNERPEALKNIRRVIALRAVSHKLGYIFDAFAPDNTHTPFVLYADGVLDITDEVLRDLSLKLSGTTLPMATAER